MKKIFGMFPFDLYYIFDTKKRKQISNQLQMQQNVEITAKYERQCVKQRDQ